MSCLDFKHFSQMSLSSYSLLPGLSSGPQSRSCTEVKAFHFSPLPLPSTPANVFLLIHLIISCHSLYEKLPLATLCLQVEIHFHTFLSPSLRPTNNYWQETGIQHTMQNHSQTRLSPGSPLVTWNFHNSIS